MTLVRLAFDVPDGTGETPASGALRWTPTKRRVSAYRVIMPAGFQVALVNGEASPEVAPTGTDWVWRVDEAIPGSPRTTRYVAVPDVAEVQYSELPDVDPRTLAPTADADPAWYAYVNVLETRAGNAMDDADASRIAAEAAQDAATGSQTSAAASAATATQKATEAGTSAFNAGQSAAAALGHANDAEEAADLAARTGLTIGTVTTVDFIEDAEATITGVNPDRKLNLAIPHGPANELEIGEVITVPGTPLDDAIVAEQVVNGTATKAALDSTYLAPKPLTAVFLGDSQTNQGGTSTSYTNRGWWVWMNAMLGHPFKVLKNAGVSGDTLTQMLARIQTDVLSYSPGWVFLFGGKNDISGSASLATLQTRYIAILDALLASPSNPKVVVVTDPPNNANTAAMNIVRDQFNAWIRELPRTRAQVVAVIDANSALTDPASNQYLTGTNFDPTHPNADGAFLIGQIAANTLKNIVPVTNSLSVGADSTNLIGSKGSFVGGTGLATGWSEYHSGAASTFTTEARTDGIPGYWQKVVTATGVHDQMIYTDATTGFSPGDTVYGIAEMIVDTPLGEAVNGLFPNYGIQVQGLNAANGGQGNAGIGLFASDGMTRRPNGVLVVRTPNITLNSDGLTTKIRIYLKPYSGATTFRFGRAAIRKA